MNNSILISGLVSVNERLKDITTSQEYAYAMIPEVPLDLIESIVERKMVNNLPVGVALNDKQACVMFPRIQRNNKIDIDMTSMFCSDDSEFHEWCLEYYRYIWHNARSFEGKGLAEV